MFEFEVNDMTCGHCVNTITKAIQDIAPSASVEVNPGKHLIRISGTSDSDGVAKAIRDAGYTPVTKT